MSYKLTLDTNCVIALEKGEPDASAIRQLIQYADIGSVDLAILGISASENQKAFNQIGAFGAFQNRISALGLGKLGLLKPIAYWDVTFWDWCIVPDSINAQLLLDLWKVIFPSSESDWPKRAAGLGLDANDLTVKEYRKWRNELCDSQIAWATIHYKYDALVTLNISDFQKKRSQLKPMGLAEIWTPAEALSNV